jgi:uncharacterized protein
MLSSLSNPFYFFLLFLPFSPCYLCSDSPQFFVEQVQTREQKQWGLMQRHYLPENQGMLFLYSRPTKPMFWSFNCYLDMSVAFIDGKGRIREIKSLYAFPEKMDPARPVRSVRDFALYPSRDPIIIFFQNNSVSPSLPITYILEMNLAWFKKNGVRVGDVLHLDPVTRSAFFESSK